MRPQLFISMAFALLVGFAACKPPAQNGSEVASLDNFAAGTKVRTNVCSASPSAIKKLPTPIMSAEGKVQFLEGTKGKEEKLRKVLGDSLTAVAPEAQVLFLNSGGKIKVTSKANSICSQNFRSGKQASPKYLLDNISTCFTWEEAGNEIDLTIYIMPEEVDIRHGMVRQFGFLYAQFYGRKYTKENGNPGMSRWSTGEVAHIKTIIAQSFLADMFSTKAFEPGVLEPLLGRGSIKKIESNFKRLQKKSNINQAIQANFVNAKGQFTDVPKNPNLDLLNGVSYSMGDDNLSEEEKKVKRRRFEDYVFAETYDSFFCNNHASYPKSAEAMAKKVVAGKASLKEKNTYLKNTNNTYRIFKDLFKNTHDKFKILVTKLHDGSKQSIQGSKYAALLKPAKKSRSKEKNDKKESNGFNLAAGKPLGNIAGTIAGLQSDMARKARTDAIVQQSYASALQSIAALGQMGASRIQGAAAAGAQQAQPAAQPPPQQMARATGGVSGPNPCPSGS